MISNIQKKEFIENIYENIVGNKNLEEAQKELISFLVNDTNNGKMYKYRAFNEYALSNLKEGTLYCAIPSSFNDPFDCRIGIDINSYIQATYGKELDGIEDYITKFLQIFDAEIPMDVCTQREKDVFNKWLESKHLCSFIEEYRGYEITDEELLKLLISNYDILHELFSGYSSNVEFLKMLNLAKDAVQILLGAQEWMKMQMK